MKELVGGLWFAGLVAWAVLGLVPGLVLMVLGGIAASCELLKEKQAAEAAANWRDNYPKYNY